MRKYYSLFVLIILMFQGCATILEDDTQSLNVRTSNNKAVTISVGGQSAVTPTSITVDRDGSKIAVTTGAEGCSSSTAVDREVDTTFFVNILSGGVYGSTTDYATGKMWEYENDIVVNCNE